MFVRANDCAAAEHLLEVARAGRCECGALPITQKLKETPYG